MEQVFNFWKDQNSADVTLLHRILMSQQVQAMNLAKLVSEFYYVDWVVRCLKLGGPTTFPLVAQFDIYLLDTLYILLFLCFTC